MQDTVTAIIFNDKGQVLSVSRKNDHNDMNLPGGKVDKGEELIEALKRECFEETGLILNDIELLYNGHWFSGYHEHTYTATAKGEINYDPIKEPALVKWVEPEVIMNGSFGKYNEMVLGLLGIKRKEVEPSIAKVRNKLSPIVNYFEMMKILNTDKNLSLEQLGELLLLINEQYKFIQDTNMNELLKLIKDDNIW